MSQPSGQPVSPWTSETCGHRGSSGRAPENTIAALKAAIEDRADWAEIDVRLTAEGVVALLHDSTLKRTTGDPRRLRDCTWVQTRALDAGAWFGQDFAGERIPSLAQAIEATRGRLRLNIEIKISPGDPAPAGPVARVLTDAGLENECVVSSSHYETLKSVRAVNPRLAIGLVIDRGRGLLLGRHVDFYSIRAKLATPEFIAAAHRLGRPVHVWTVNQPSALQACLALGVDVIITDYPARLNQLRIQSEPASA